ncbi:hypothetical protein Vadar_010425 [Vaccinium darrowii]|uniref:Uncharacterized protein n=1 Tax=Vaccinium darrowii TaxID=229202 RepID=A0ACB7ZBQ0_9ERIC|nr:hypothetical protein Vadar_010425 [Vaccinium darrowii]
MVTCEYKDLSEPVKLPGCVPVHSRDLLDPVQDRSHIAYKKLLENTTRFTSSEGIIINSFLDVEEGAIKALQVQEPEQKMNVVMLNEGLNVALRPKMNEIGIVEKEEIARVVKELVKGEGKKVRQKMKGLQEAAGKVLNEDGSSANALSELAFRWKN